MFITIVRTPAPETKCSSGIQRTKPSNFAENTACSCNGNSAAILCIPLPAASANPTILLSLLSCACTSDTGRCSTLQRQDARRPSLITVPLIRESHRMPRWLTHFFRTSIIFDKQFLPTDRAAPPTCPATPTAPPPPPPPSGAPGCGAPGCGCICGCILPHNRNGSADTNSTVCSRAACLPPRCRERQSVR